MNTIIRKIRPEEHVLLREFLYQAIYLPEDVEPPPRSVVDLPELQVYIEDFGTRPGDHCLVVEVEEKVVGAAWSRITVKINPPMLCGSLNKAQHKRILFFTGHSLD